MDILENQIEDVLVAFPLMLQDILKLDDEPRLLARQLPVPSGRLDLLFTYRSELLLLELKVVAFQRRFLQQVLGYKDDLANFQSSGKLVKGRIRPYLLYTKPDFTKTADRQISGVTCVAYNPANLLKHFYDNLRPIAHFSDVKPIDIGIWNLHLIHGFLYLLHKTNSVNRLRKLIGGSQKTLYNKIKFASELRLVDWQANQDAIVLSKLGREYVSRSATGLPERLSDGQIDLLRKFVAQNPYESSIVLGIASVVEATFILSKNTYPIQMKHLIECFSYFAGKYFDWKTPKAKYNATRMYSNYYAVDLGLLAKSGDSVYFTPDGLRFTLQLQLHKSLKMVNLL